MAVKVIGKVIGHSDNTETRTAAVLPVTPDKTLTESKEKSKEENRFLDLNNVQNSKPTDIIPKNTLQKDTPLKNTPPKAEKTNDSDAQGENKEIAFFTEPKTVKRKTQRHIFGFQAVTAAAVCLIMLLLKFLAPQLYDNLHLYFLRLFQW